MRSANRRQQFRSGRFIALITTGFFIAIAMLPIQRGVPRQTDPLPRLIFAVSPQATQAQQQFLRIEEAAAQVYALEPDLPLENQYVNEDTGRVSDRNTLLSRLIRYHSYVRGRPFTYRLDWKLTLADYLGANERVIASTYPGVDTLRPSPHAGDIAAINRLTRNQRDRLVNALVSVYAVYTPPAAPAAPSSAEPPASSASQFPEGVIPPSTNIRPAPQPAPRPAAPSLQSPQPGDAQLLAP
ncbi:hypothetical protein NDI45_19530 [Leptolyngbya sp. GB1-A1]|uniref:hypothetical protein n=1 Tax=Leptolyngbya sp. GB1-A1 TaxID=2933908 RepID=UPI00329A114F